MSLSRWLRRDKIVKMCEIEAQSDVLREQKNKLYERNTQLKAAYIEIDEQKRHIMDSIYYARRIQTAILPSGELIEKYLRMSSYFKGYCEW
ncbi:MAG: hypothetical protein R2727_06690 [Bacteroidales bacterium]